MEGSDGKAWQLTVSSSKHHELTVNDMITALKQGLGSDFAIDVLYQLGQPSALQQIDLHIRSLPASPEVDTSGHDFKDRKIKAQCDLMDKHLIPNGTKAIAIAMLEYWTAEFEAAFGKHDAPATIKDWRTQQAKLRVDVLPALPQLRPARKRRTDRSGRKHSHDLRFNHAFRTVSSRGCMKRGYAEAIREVRSINANQHPTIRAPESPLRSFSYDTFRRDCQSVAAQLRLDAPAKRHRR